MHTFYEIDDWIKKRLEQLHEDLYNINQQTNKHEVGTREFYDLWQMRNDIVMEIDVLGMVSKKNTRKEKYESFILNRSIDFTSKRWKLKKELDKLKIVPATDETTEKISKIKTKIQKYDTLEEIYRKEYNKISNNPRIYGSI